jgi:hypothetical protein
MHIWQSKQVLKTSKLWHLNPPKNASAEDYKAWKAVERDYKYTMLGILKKEKTVDEKKK